MLPEKYQWVVQQFEPEGEPRLLFEIAARLEADGNLEGAATVYDRAFGLDPTDEEVRAGRDRVLEALAVTEYGLHFRYVPGGSFLMGSLDGEADERPWHPVWLSPFWLSETPVSWEAYCQLMDWEAPPVGLPRGQTGRQWDLSEDRGLFFLYHANKIRLQYCEDSTLRARDWHSHHPGQTWQHAGQTQTAQEVFGAPERSDPEAPWAYGAKPMVAAAWQEATELAARLSTPGVRYSLPTEAQWEKAARGGLIGARYAWGDEPPTSECCDFGRFREFSVRPMKTFPPNAYGLYAMCGGVGEWTGDWYDSEAYRRSIMTDPTGPAEGQQKVLRGGSWADCAEAVTVSYRHAAASSGRNDQPQLGSYSPNYGFRLCRMRAPTEAAG
jgi:formylglycine-generating enzyme required for sulfatase activity